MTEENCVKTAVRWRPAFENKDIIDKETIEHSVVCVSHKAKNCKAKNSKFLFDHVFDGSNQQEVFEMLVEPLVEKAIEGFNCTFLTTGQTSSGKTYSMGFETGVNPENEGMTNRVLNAIFGHENANRIKVLVSFIQIYQNEAFDLLSKNTKKAFFTKAHHVSEPVKMTVRNEIEAQHFLSGGMRNREVRNTNMNSISSRSHAIFTINLEVQQDSGKIRRSAFNLVDLAGSESAGKAGNNPESQAEGKCINESLTAFQRVITALATTPKPLHIPFRDSVITRILEKPLSEKCFLTMLGCLSPYVDDYGGTLSTLRFVAKAKEMKMSPELNEIVAKYQKSKTPIKIPIKNVPYTPSSIPRAKFPFKRPTPLTNIKSWQNKFSRHFLLMSEPRRTSANKQHTVNRFSASTKLIQPKNLTRQSLDNDLNKSKKADNLFTPKNKPVRPIITPAVQVPIVSESDPNFQKLISEMGNLSNLNEAKMPLYSSINTTHPMDVDEEDLPCVERSPDTTEIPKNDSSIEPVQPKKTTNEHQPCMETSLDTTLPPNCLQTEQFDMKSPTEIAERVTTTKEIPDLSYVDEPMEQPFDKSVNEFSEPHLQDLPAATSMNESDFFVATTEKTLDSTLKENQIESQNAHFLTPEKAGINRKGINPKVTPLCIRVKTYREAADNSYVVVRKKQQTVSKENSEENVRDASLSNEMVMDVEDNSFQNHNEIRPAEESFAAIEPVAVIEPVASRAKTTRFPLSPRIILEGIENISEYKKWLSRQSASDEETGRKPKSKRAKTSQSKATSKKTKTKKTQIINSEKKKQRQDTLNTLNNGSEKELRKLMGIGEKKANAILKSRKCNGRFESIEALKERKILYKQSYDNFVQCNSL